jgi:hypothetical protein
MNRKRNFAMQLKLLSMAVVAPCKEKPLTCLQDIGFGKSTGLSFEDLLKAHTFLRLVHVLLFSRDLQ